MSRIQVAVFAFADLDTASLQLCEVQLPEDERQALSARHPVRVRQVQTRLRLRQLLAAATGVAESELRFARDDKGKPFLVEPAGWSFNLSHSRQACAIAWTNSGLALGIDIEDRQRRLRSHAMAEHVLSSAERALWQARGEQQDDWLQLWTQKEALLKVSGSGLSLAPASVDTLCRDAQGIVTHPALGALQLRSWLLPTQCLSLAWPAGEKMPAPLIEWQLGTNLAPLEIAPLSPPQTS